MLARHTSEVEEEELTVGHRFPGENLACTPKSSINKVSARHLHLPKHTNNSQYLHRLMLIDRKRGEGWDSPYSLGILEINLGLIASIVLDAIVSPNICQGTKCQQGRKGEGEGLGLELTISQKCPDTSLPVVESLAF